MDQQSAASLQNEKEHEEWLKSKAKFATETKPLNKGKQQVVIGIDSGSTTTKIVAVRVNMETPTGDIVFTNYRLNLGNPIKAVADGLNALKQEAALRGAELEIVGSCSTGYGEELIRGGFRPRQRHYRNNGARKSGGFTHA